MFQALWWVIQWWCWACTLSSPRLWCLQSPHVESLCSWLIDLEVWIVLWITATSKRLALAVPGYSLCVNSVIKSFIVFLSHSGLHYLFSLPPRILYCSCWRVYQWAATSTSTVSGPVINTSSCKSLPHFTQSTKMCFCLWYHCLHMCVCMSVLSADRSLILGDSEKLKSC